jgi:hypothetical protein
VKTEEEPDESHLFPPGYIATFKSTLAQAQSDEERDLLLNGKKNLFAML